MDTIVGTAAPYHAALIALALICLTVLVQGFLAGVLGLAQSDEVPGRPLKGDHPDFSFRVIRTYGNATENLPAFLTAVGLAIIAGVNPMIVNWLAALHVAARMAYWAIYYRGIGKTGGGIRTIAYVVGLFANLALAATALYVLVA